MPLTHKIDYLTVIFHPGGDVCPLSKGSHCPHTGDNGLPHFEDEKDLEKARNVPNLRKLVGCIGCSEFPNGGPHHGRFGYENYPGGGVPPGLRTDSGVGESLEGMTVSSGYSNPYATLTAPPAHAAAAGPGGRFGSFEEGEQGQQEIGPMAVQMTLFPCLTSTLLPIVRIGEYVVPF